MTMRPGIVAGRCTPSDPEEFVARAQQITNDRDVAAIRAMFTADATWTTVIDGAVHTAHGIEEIHRRWRLLCRFMRARRLSVRKRLIVADDHHIVSDWTGDLGRHGTARGVEVWRFGPQSLLVDQTLYGFLGTGPETALTQNLRMLTAHPRSALTFARLRHHERTRS